MDNTAVPTRMPILVTANAERAERWARALDAAEVDVLVELSDAQLAQPGGSALVGAVGGRPMQFVHVLTVWPGDRERALAALIDAGWDGREGATWREPTSPRTLALGAAVAVGLLTTILLVRITVG